MSHDKREELIDEILADLSFTIVSNRHRQELKEALGGEEEIRALEQFLTDRFYEEGDFMESIGLLEKEGV